MIQNRQKFLRFTISIVFCATLSHSETETYWNQFRGPNSQGRLAGTNPPVCMNPETHVKWCCDLPSGHSSPVIWDDKIFLTAFNENKNLETLCINRHNGDILWRKIAPAESIESFHPSNSPAASTPAAGRDHVYVYFGSFGLLCYDHDGNEIWNKPIPTPKCPIDQGSGVSPMIHDGKLYFVYGSMDKSSYLLCLDCQTGEEVWKTFRPFAITTYSTPIVWKTSGKVFLVVASNGKLSFYDPSTGREIWWITGLASSAISAPVLGDGKVYCSTKTMGGFDNSYETEWSWTVILENDTNQNGMIEIDELKDGFLFPQRRYLPRDNQGFGFWIKDASRAMASYDTDKDGILSKEDWLKSVSSFTKKIRANICAVKPGTEGDCTESSVIWRYTRHITEVPSILYEKNRIYSIKDGGLFLCLNAETGEALYIERVKARGQYMSSPVTANGRIYVCSVTGVMTVLQTGDEFKILQVNDFGEQIYATPALNGDEIYVRTVNHLYAFSE